MIIRTVVIGLFAIASQAAQISLKALGDEKFKSGQLYDALDLYSRALKHEPSNPSILINRGLVSFKLDDFDEAIADFNKALNVKKTGKGFYWLGRSYLKKNDLSRAHYFLSTAIFYDEPLKNIDIYIENASEKHEEFLLKIDEITKQNDIGNFCENYRKVDGSHVEFLTNSFFTSEYGKFVNSMACHWNKRGYNPVAVMEHPEKIARFIGKGKHIATVLVQTIPLHFSKNFERVSVFDTAKPQIDFHRHLVSAIKIDAASQFIAKAQQELKEFFDGQNDIPLDATLKPRVGYEFEQLYKFLDDFTFRDIITLYHQDIFAGVDADESIDVVFLSSIPFLKRADWQRFYYPKIRQWLSANKTVVFSILGSGLYVDAIFEELTERFSDIAKMERTVFEETPTTIQVKLMPKLDYI
jgi:tetratricopeptide (TPR) repeat protein